MKDLINSIEPVEGMGSIAVYHTKEVNKQTKDLQECLEALIERVRDDEECLPDDSSKYVKKLWKHLFDDIKLIERITGKKWSEVRDD